MTQPLRLGELPLEPHGSMRFDAARLSHPGPFLFDPASAALDAVAVGRGGRRAAWFVQGEFGRGVLRHYRRGGLIARLSADRYIWTGPDATRSFAEFGLLRFMHEAGLPVPRPIAAAYWRRGPSYRAAIVVERIEGVEPLAVRLEPQGGGAMAQAVAQAVFDMHEAGVWHADLNAYNILLDAQGKVWLIDFDKGRRLRSGRGRRQANLLRLRRSLLKVAGEGALPWWRELERAYWRLAGPK